MWTGYTSYTPHNMQAASTEIWIQVFSDSSIYSTDLIRNGDFEASGSNFNNYGIPVGWSTNTAFSNNVATIMSVAGTTPTLQGSHLTGESGSFCGNSHVLIAKSVGKLFQGINQTIYVPEGIFRFYFIAKFYN